MDNFIYDIPTKVYFGKDKDPSYNIKIGNMLDIRKEPKHNNVIYTCITGSYDTPMPLSYKNTNFNYICYTDNPTIKSDFWEMKPLPEKLKNLDDVRKNRYVKLHPHEFFPDYNLSIYIDGNVDIRGDVDEFLNKYCKNTDSVFFAGQHPQRNCTYKEAKAIIDCKKDIPSNINPQISAYENEGFPKNFGLTQNCILVRYHNDKNCINLMNAWWEEVKNRSYRDQMSLMYCMWKTNFKQYKILDKTLFNSGYFKWGKCHRKFVQPAAIAAAPKKNVSKTASAPQKEKINEKKSRESLIDEMTRLGTPMVPKKTYRHVVKTNTKVKRTNDIRLFLGID